MDIREKRELYRSIITAITGRQITGGIEALLRFAGKSGATDKLADLESEEEIYHQMLRYFLMDAPDPSRDVFRDEMSRRLLVMADELFARSLSSSFHSEWHAYRHRPAGTPPFRADDLALANSWLHSMDSRSHSDTEPVLERLFCSIWMSNVLTENHLGLIREHLLDEETAPALSILLVSALILHTLEKFSPGPWMLMAEVYEAQIPQLWQRALIGMLLVLIRFEHRMSLYPAIGQRMILMSESPLFIPHLEKAAIQLIRTGDTEKVSRRVQEEIIPEMMKLAPKIQEQLSLDQLIRDEAGEEKNPEWEKFFEESPGMYEKMEELNRLQLEGADLFISTFSRLKNFPFFKNTVNWFLPFHHRHPSLTTTFADEEENSAITRFLEAFEHFPVMCNSDKYSFSFNLSAMPALQRSMLMNTLAGEITGIITQSSDDDLVSEVKGHEVFHQFSQDLYRFFRLHPLRHETEDPFAMRKQLYQCQTITPLLELFPALARRIGEYYFQQDHYTHAITLFGYPEQLPQESPELFQKIAYAWQMTGDLDMALEYYRRAELFDSNALWNLRKIAWVHQLRNNIPDAIKAYRDAERLEPASVQIKVSIGNLLLQNNQWDEALEYYRKAEELRPESVKTLRPLAWCLFLKGELEASAHYYEIILEGSSNHNDLLNFGHVKFTLRDKQGAASLYTRSMNHRSNSPQAFSEAYRNDAPHLKRLGLTPEEIAFMLDAVVLNC